jgi:hypothetical protein
MADFSWIAEIKETEWTAPIRGKRYLGLSREEFAGKCGLANDDGLVTAFYEWASTERHSYALVWDRPLAANGVLLLVLRKIDA